MGHEVEPPSLTRPEAIYVLATTRTAYLPSPRQPSSLLSATAGLAEGRRAPCADCQARGRMGGNGKPCIACPPLTTPNAERVRDAAAKHGCRPCLICDGTGWRRARPGEAYDEYARSPVRTAEQREPPEKLWQRAQETERQLAHVDAVLDVWLHPEHEQFRWERERERFFRAGDYLALDRALEVVRHHWPHRVARFVAVLVNQDYGPAPPLVELTPLVTDAMRLVDVRMPSPIRVPRWLLPERDALKTSTWRGRTYAHGQRRGERDEQIRKLRADGWKVSRLATHFNLTERRVRQIAPVGSVASV